MKKASFLGLKAGFSASLLLLICLIDVSDATCQSIGECARKLLDSLPQGLILSEKTPQRYYVTTDYFNRDIYGNFFNKMRVTGEYTRGLEGGNARWNNVQISKSNSESGDFPVGTQIQYMEDFKFTASTKMMESSFFYGFPNDPESVYAKNLVWDMVGIEAFAWVYFDSLKLNQTIPATAINGQMQMENVGSFQNKHIQLTWRGISAINGETCALIEYLAMDNPLTISMNNLEMKGRSHYWGNVWVSLNNKQIEYATMNEDVILDIKIPNSPNQVMNTIRKITMEKIQ